MSDRLANLRLARGQIVARLDDPRTPPYSIAPLTNQLRLIERDIARLTAADDVDEGLPDPELFGFVTALGYESWLRRGSVQARRRPSDYPALEGEVFQAWSDAGFVLSPRPGPDDEIEEWVTANRVELIRCLAEADE